MVEPVHPRQGGEFHRVPVGPGAAVNDLRLVQAVDGLGQGIIVGVPDAADGGFDACLLEAFGIADRYVLLGGDG